MEPTIAQFLEFANSLKENECEWAEWERFQQRTYHDLRIEQARVNIGLICDADDSVGNPKWPLTKDAIVEIGLVIEELSSSDS